MSKHTWNHRVVKQAHPWGWSYGIHECHYEDHSFHAFTTEPTPALACLETGADETDDPVEAKRQLRETLERMLKALDKPVVLATETEPRRWEFAELP